MTNDPESLRLPTALVEVLSNGSLQDIEFAEEPVATHFDLPDIKVGYKPTMIRGVTVPSALRVMYIRGNRDGEVYWYVVSWRGCELVPICVDANSEDNARAIVLDELRRWAELL